MSTRLSDIANKPSSQRLSDVQGSKRLSDVQSANPPSIEGVLGQFAIGAGNAAAFSVPELLYKKEFDKLASSSPVERVARGVGTTAGTVVGLPQMAFKVGEKIALKGIAKILPNLNKAATTGSQVAKSALTTTGGVVATNAFDPSKTPEEKIKSLPTDVLLGTALGAASVGIQKVLKAPKKISLKAQDSIKTATADPAVYADDGQIIMSNPPRPTSPSVADIIKKDMGKPGEQLVNQIELTGTEIEAARRGIIPDEVAKKLALKHSVDWKNIKSGTVLNEEQMLAHRIDFRKRTMDYFKNPTVEARNGLIEDAKKLQGLTSEAGRTLRATGIDVSTQAEADFLRKAVGATDPELKASLGKLGDDFKTPGFWDWHQEFRVAGLVSSPFSQMKNVIGNAIYTAFRPFERAVAGNANKVESFLTGNKREVYSRESIANIVGLHAGLRPALRNAISAFKNPDFKSDARLLEAVKTQKAIPGIFGEIIRFPFRGLGATDEFFSTLSKVQSLYESATRKAIQEKAPNLVARIEELAKNPTADMIAEAAKQKMTATFRGDLGSAGKAFSHFVNNAPGGKFIVPFLKTPINLFKWSFQRGPTSLISPQNWRDIAKGTPQERADAVSKVAFGQVVTLGMFMEASQGNITGRLSSDKRRVALLQSQGVQPYSIKIGDKYYSYRGFEPLATWLGMVANTSEILKENNKRIDSSKGLEIVKETLSLMKDQSFVQGIGDLIDALEDPENKGQRFIQNMAGSYVPSIVGYGARLADPVIRDPGSIPDALKARIPYLSKGVSPKLDAWGRVITKEGSLAQRALLPTNVTTVRPDMTTEELLSLEYYPQKLMKRYIGIPLTVQERNSIDAIEFTVAKEYLDKVTATREYQSSSPQQQQDIMSDVFSKVRKEVRKPFLDRKAVQEIRKISNPDDKLRLIEKHIRKQLIKE